MTPADTSDFTAIHTCLRAGTRALAAALGALDVADRARVDALRRYWKGFAGEVLAHHTVEDEVFYPALVLRVPAAAEHIGRIDADHHLLDMLMDEAHKGFAALDDAVAVARLTSVLVRLDELMQHHLDFEDAELVPLFSAHFSEDEYAQLTKAAMKVVGVGKQAAFTVPFIASIVDDEMRAHLLSNAPMPFRVILRLTETRHLRLAQRALGGSFRLLMAEPAVA